MHGFSRGGKKFGNKGGGGGLSVGTGYAVLFAGAKVKENLHFAGDGLAIFTKGAKRRTPPVHARCAENNVCVYSVKIAFSKQELCSGGFKLIRRRAELFAACLISGFGFNAFFGKHFYNVLVAYADADKGDLLFFHFIKKFFRYVHINTSQKAKFYSEEYNDGRKRQNRIRLVTIFFSIAYLSLK